jgi:ABC-2 type transport system ATP-binding protein
MLFRKWLSYGLAALFIFGFLPSTAAAQTTPLEIVIVGAARSSADATAVQLDSDLYLPTTLPAPAIVLAHGFGSSKTAVAKQAENLRAAGYVVVAYTARGFGKSTGLISMNSPQFEIADAAKVIDYLANRPEVIKDDVNDPRVGFAGASYGGA